MSEEYIIILVGGAILLTVFAIFIPLIIRDMKRVAKENTPERLRAEEERRLNDEGEITVCHAAVTDMLCGVNTVGHQAYKQPRAERMFIIKFKTDEGEILNVPVSEELYEGFEVGLSGELRLVDGQISSFLPDGE